MHSYNTNNTTFLFNGDGSGNVLISQLESLPGNKKKKLGQVEVPVEDVLDFVANLVRNAKIAELEQADAKDVLGLVR